MAKSTSIEVTFLKQKPQEPLVTVDVWCIGNPNLAAFAWSGVENVVIPESVKAIGEEVFRCCKSLKGVTIPDSVKEIGDDAFNGCESLKEVDIGNSVECGGLLFAPRIFFMQVVDRVNCARRLRFECAQNVHIHDREDALVAPKAS